jgi:hypothetical protein
MRQQLVKADARAAAIASRQHGVITAEQLAWVGLSPSAISRRVAAGRLFRVYRGVYAVGHPGLSAKGRYKAATLACGEGCALSHRSAGALWEMIAPADGPVHVTVPVAGGRAIREGIRIHRSPSLVARFVTVRDNIPVTRPRRTLEDLRSELDEGELRNALRRGEFLRLPLDGFSLTGNATESELERIFLALCRRFRIQTPETQVRIDRYRVDFLWRAEKLIVETDGYRYHRGSVAFEDDRAETTAWPSSATRCAGSRIDR